MAQWHERTKNVQELHLLPDFVVTVFFAKHGWVMHCKKLNLHYRQLAAGDWQSACAEALAHVQAVMDKMNDALNTHRQPQAV